MIVFWVIAVGLAFWALRNADRIATLVRRTAGWVRRGASPPPPAGPPIERIAADLRRLRSELDQLRVESDRPYRTARMEATLLAYDDRLVDACRALRVEQRLRDRNGPPRPLERTRVERALAAQGLMLRPAPRH